MNWLTLSKLPRGLYEVLFVGEDNGTWTNGDVTVSYFKLGDYWKWETKEGRSGSAPDSGMVLHDLAEAGHSFK